MKITLMLMIALLSGMILPPSLLASRLTGAAPQDGRTVEKPRGPAKPVVIPVTIITHGSREEPELQTIDLNVIEDGEPQDNLSVRAVGTNSPITMAVLIQDDLVNSIANETKGIAEFIRSLPKGSRVMVGYIRTGTLQVPQKFTGDLERAAKAVRVPLGLASAAPFNPYVEVLEGLNRFVSQPGGRRAILLISDGLDVSRGVDAASVTQSIDLQRAIKRAQQRSVAIYSIYAPSAGLAAGNSILASYAQSSLQRLSSETGGKAFFQGLNAPVSFDPFLRAITSALDRQVALTYLSTHTNKGFHRLQIRSSAPGVELNYPSGYSR